MREGFYNQEGSESICAYITLKSVQLPPLVSLLDLQHGQSLERFSVGYSRVSNARTLHSGIQRDQYDRIIRLYRLLVEVELLSEFLTLLRGCIIGRISITIVDGRARPLLFRPLSALDVERLLNNV